GETPPWCGLCAGAGEPFAQRSFVLPSGRGSPGLAIGTDQHQLGNSRNSVTLRGCAVRIDEIRQPQMPVDHELPCAIQIPDVHSPDFDAARAKLRIETVEQWQLMHAAAASGS